MALLLPIFHMNLVLKEYRRGRILWHVAGKVKVAGKERASRWRTVSFLTYTIINETVRRLLRFT